MHPDLVQRQTENGGALLAVLPAELAFLPFELQHLLERRLEQTIAADDTLVRVFRHDPIPVVAVPFQGTPATAEGSGTAGLRNYGGASLMRIIFGARRPASRFAERRSVAAFHAIVAARHRRWARGDGYGLVVNAPASSKRDAWRQRFRLSDRSMNAASRLKQGEGDQRHRQQAEHDDDDTKPYFAPHGNRLTGQGSCVMCRSCHLLPKR